MSKTVASSLSGLVRLGSAWMKPYRRTITRALTSEKLAQIMTVEAAGVPVRFFIPTARSFHDPWHINSDEPETIRWLDRMAADEVLWDIGANVGVYALYAAIVKRIRVLAFEPSASTYAVLVRNVEINNLSGKIDAYCLAFDEHNHLEYLNMARSGAGHSMHAFGQTQSVQGEISVAFRQAVPGFSIDSFRDIFSPPPPDHIKLDVDSIELKILRGAANTLTQSVKTVLVEIDGKDKVTSRKDITTFLRSRGFAEDTAFTAQGARRNVLFRRS
ncbi:MAG TPA: FkbM family methyltransferase [Stellaceae bacterium]|nr:FkbM family methyltransferase [Stellaceae bacterium]